MPVIGDRSDGTDALGPVGLHLQRITKRYGTRRVLHELDLHVAPGEFVAIVGRSGCGKSTLLRIAAGLEAADGGAVRLTDDADASHLRIMFQEPRLLPWKRVVDNVALGLSSSTTDVRAHALAVLDSVGLADRAEDWPGVLSGGQRQRVALARALAHRPRLMLFDEPLGALDALTRIEMQALIETLRARRSFTALFVTHDVEEAVALADRVVLLTDGRVTLDLPVALPRPRRRTDPAFAAIEERVLGRLLTRAA